MLDNYDKFIDEIFRLDIGSVKYFVSKEGRILYDRPVQNYLEQDPDGEKWPGHLSTFYDLSRYDEHNKIDNYSDLLNSLKKRALREVRLLEPAQQKRLLPDLKNMSDSLLSLMKRNRNYVLNWRKVDYDYVDDDPLFTELGVKGVLTVPHLPEASPHLRYFEYLDDALKYKYSHLKQLITDIEGESIQGNTSIATTPEKTLQPEPVNKPEAKFFISPDIQQDLRDLLKPFFPQTTELHLMEVLRGDRDGDVQLVFNDSGNKLACLFRELYSFHVVGPSKSLVEQWLLRNFQYFDKKEGGYKDYTARYLNNIISSSNVEACKNPIATVKNTNNKVVLVPKKHTTKEIDKKNR